MEAVKMSDILHVMTLRNEKVGQQKIYTIDN